MSVPHQYSAACRHIADVGDPYALVRHLTGGNDRISAATLRTFDLMPIKCDGNASLGEVGRAFNNLPAVVGSVAEKGDVSPR